MFHRSFLYLLFFLSSHVAYGQIDNGFTLITTLYNEKNPDRAHEFVQCIENNLAHPLINEIIIFYDTVRDDQENNLLRYLQSKPITIHYIQGRATYKMCFNLANKSYPNKKIIVCNGDIYFNETLDYLKNYDFTHTFLAITRWDVQPDNTLVRHTNKFSQDAWIFQTPISLKKSNFEMGTWACDCSIAYWARKSGLKVLNPSFTIQPCHMHASNLRTWEFKARHSIKRMIGVMPTTIDAKTTEYPSLYQALKVEDPVLLAKLQQDLANLESAQNKK